MCVYEENEVGSENSTDLNSNNQKNKKKRKLHNPHRFQAIFLWPIYKYVIVGRRIIFTLSCPSTVLPFEFITVIYMNHIREQITLKNCLPFSSFPEKLDHFLQPSHCVTAWTVIWVQMRRWGTSGGQISEAWVDLPEFAGVGCSLNCSASRRSLLGSVNETGLCLCSLRVHRQF